LDLHTKAKKLKRGEEHPVLGRVVIPLASLDLNEPLDDWYLLNSGVGMLRIQLELIRYDSDAVRCMPASANAKRKTIEEGEEGDGEEGEGASHNGARAVSVPTPVPTTPAHVARTPRRIGSVGDESDCSSNGSVSDDEGFA